MDEIKSTKKLGILLNDFGANQKTLAIIRKLNLLHLNGKNVVLYLAEQSPHVINCSFPIFFQKEAWMSRCIMIANDIDTANKLLEMPGPYRKMLYIWDLQWLFINDQIFDSLKKIYSNNEIELISPSKHYYDVLLSVWSKPSHLCPNFSIEKIL
jgi:hypothetical protein